MTSIISLKKVRCKNCHKCIRSCPVNSIMYREDQAQIMPEQCILCGHCLNTCPQNAKTVLYVAPDLENVAQNRFRTLRTGI